MRIVVLKNGVDVRSSSHGIKLIRCEVRGEILGYCQRIKDLGVCLSSMNKLELKLSNQLWWVLWIQKSWAAEHFMK